MPQTLQTLGEDLHGKTMVVVDPVQDQARGAGKDKIKQEFQLFSLIIGKLLLPLVYNVLRGRRRLHRHRKRKEHR